MTNMLMNVLGKPQNSNQSSRLGYGLSSIIGANKVNAIKQKPIVRRNPVPAPPPPPPPTVKKATQLMSLHAKRGRYAGGGVYGCAEIMASGKTSCGSCARNR